jgi:hypothetical protein
MRRSLAAAAVLVVLAVSGSTARADLLFLKDNNIIELREVKREKRVLQQGTSPQWCYVGKNRDGKLEIIPERDLMQGGYRPEKKTSWEITTENKNWYKAEAPKIKADDWKAQLAFAKKCADRKMSNDLDEEAEVHFKKAYELEFPTIAKDNEKQLEIFAKKVRDDYDLYDEALAVFRDIMALKKKNLVDKEATPDVWVRLGKEAKDLELWDEAKVCFDKALELNEKHSEAKKQLKELAKDNEVPLNMQMYRRLSGPFKAGIKLVKANQTPEGWFGGDFTEAGVHGRRGISGVCTYALFADYQLQKRAAMDKDKAAELPKELEKALLFLMKGEDGMGTEGRLEGDDMWGAIFAAEALVMCATDDFIMAKYGDQLRPAIHKHVERLKSLQRSDGGWYYYNFVRDSSSFSTASTLIILETLKNMGAEKELSDGMIPGAISLIKKMRQGLGTYKYMEMGSGYHASSSPLGASARSPLCEFALYCAESSDPQDYRQAIFNWRDNVHLLKKIKGREGTHIGKGSTAPYYFLYSHMYMARAVKANLSKSQSRQMLNMVAGLMLSYQEPDGAWTDWKLPTDEPMKFKVSQTAMGLITLWHLMSGDRDPAVAPLRGGGVVVNPGTATETGTKKPVDPKPEEPKKD